MANTKSPLTIQQGFPGQMGLLAEQMNQGFGGGLLAQQNYLKDIYSPYKMPTGMTPTPDTPDTPTIKTPTTLQEFMANKKGMTDDQWFNYIKGNFDLWRKLQRTGGMYD